jgi:FolB domain-containing protein
MLSEIFSINISNLKLETFIGIYPEEKNKKQPLIFDINIKYLAKKINQTNNINDAIDYHDLCLDISDFVESNKFQLLETLINQLQDKIFSDVKIIESEIFIKKPEALKKFGAMVSVSSKLTR